MVADSFTNFDGIVSDGGLRDWNPDRKFGKFPFTEPIK